MHECDVHTLLRLPTGLFYAQGVKANVIFFESAASARLTSAQPRLRREAPAGAKTKFRRG